MCVLVFRGYELEWAILCDRLCFGDITDTCKSMIINQNVIVKCIKLFLSMTHSFKYECNLCVRQMRYSIHVVVVLKDDIIQLNHLLKAQTLSWHQHLNATYTPF